MREAALLAKPCNEVTGCIVPNLMERNLYHTVLRVTRVFVRGFLQDRMFPISDSTQHIATFFVLSSRQVAWRPPSELLITRVDDVYRCEHLIPSHAGGKNRQVQIACILDVGRGRPLVIAL